MTNPPSLATRFFATAPILGLTLVRLGLGTSMTWHGFEKLLPPPHSAQTGLLAGIHYFRSFVVMLGLPAWLGYMSIFAEFVGGILLLLGLFTRFAASLVTINMLVALITVNAHKGLMASEYTLALIVMAVALLISGAGAFSIDRLLARRP